MEHKLKILLVDDEADLLEVIAERCVEHFDVVLTALNGIEALEVCKQEKVSIVLSDINMPGMKGDEFLRQLRAMGDMTPVVFLTGHGNKEIVLSALRLGGADVIDKPFRFEELIDTLNRVIEIEKRKDQLHELKSVDDESKKRKMIGLLQVANERKKIS